MPSGRVFQLGFFVLKYQGGGVVSVREKTSNFCFKKRIFLSKMLEEKNKNHSLEQGSQKERILSWKNLKKRETKNDASSHFRLGLKSVQVMKRIQNDERIIKKESFKTKINFKKVKSFIIFNSKQFAIFFKDHFNLLVQSSAKNHLRIQQCKKMKAGDACNLNFNSYSELKKYQKKVRLFTYSFSSTAFSILIAIVFMQIFFGAGKSKGANYTFTQINWSDGASAVTADSNSQDGWKKFKTKDANISATSNSISFTQVTSGTTGDSTGYLAAPAGFYLDGSILTLKKVANASCTGNSQCLSGSCVSSACVGP